MKRGVLSLCAVVLQATTVIWATGCSRAGSEVVLPAGDGIPEGYARVEVKLTVKGAPEYATRTSYPIDRIDNVNLFWFTDEDGNGQIDDGDPLTERRYFEYGTRQEIYLKRGQVYFVYAVANLEDSHCPNGDLSTYFDDVSNYGELKNKYILNDDPPTPDRKKIVMAAKEVETLSLPEDPEPDKKISPEILLERVFARFIINIYNRVNPADRRVLSNVDPVSMSGLDFTRGSYLFPRDNGDFDPAVAGYAGDGYFQPRPVSLVADGTEPIVQYPENSGKYYTKQTFEIYTFENRKGSVDGINGSGSGTIPDVYNRYDMAPEEATRLRINSLISQDAPTQLRGKALLTWIHAGKGRKPENNFPDDVTNFDVERNTVYHFNIVINGIENIEIDSRREYLDQMVLFELPNAANSIDAHYVDMPGYISGNANGIVKIQSGTGTMIGDIVTDWTPMKDTDDDEEKWLRFSIYDPQSPSYLVGDVPVTWYTPQASTSIYVNMPDGGLSKRRLLLHFNENVNWYTGTGAVPSRVNNGVPIADNPPFRTALIRIGFVEGAHTETDYESMAAQGGESVFYQSVRQYGLKTIGAVGGYVAGQGYIKLLGIESVEESQVLYYTTSGLVPPPPYDATNQVFWQYRSGTAGNTNQAYDGMAATRAIYNDYRSNNIPPQRGQTNISPASGAYNPFTNTNAADYCMRKNRDENGDGIISGAEVKWYLPTPVQMSQLFQWREAFRYPLNQGYLPFGFSTETVNYWTTNESNAANALVSTFSGTVNTTVEQVKTNRRAVRCVRDIDGDMGGMFYYSSDGHLVANLAGHLPNLNYNKYNNAAENNLRDQAYNNIAPAFIISKWYTSPNNASNNIVTPPVFMEAKKPCENYSESGYGTGTWWPPSERELALIYAYADALNNMLLAANPGAPLPYGSNSTFHYLQKEARHWGMTNVGSNDAYWYIDFATGASYQQSKNNTNAYIRCVRYLNPNVLPS